MQPKIFAVAPLAEGTDGGNHGPSPQGYVRYWVTRYEVPGEPLETANIAMYFDETGELWVTHGTAIGEAADHRGVLVTSAQKVTISNALK